MQDRFKKVIEKIIVPHFNNIEYVDVREFHKPLTLRKTVYQVEYGVNSEFDMKDYPKLVNETISLFKMLGPSDNEALLDVLVQPV